MRLAARRRFGFAASVIVSVLGGVQLATGCSSFTESTSDTVDATNDGGAETETGGDGGSPDAGFVDGAGSLDGPPTSGDAESTGCAGWTPASQATIDDVTGTTGIRACKVCVHDAINHWGFARRDLLTPTAGASYGMNGFVQGVAGPSTGSPMVDFGIRFEALDGTAVDKTKFNDTALVPDRALDTMSTDLIAPATRAFYSIGLINADEGTCVIFDTVTFPQ